MSAFNRSHQFVRHLGGAHLGFKIIGGDIGGRYQDAIFARIGLFDPAVEEKGDMGVLFGFRDAQLMQAQLGDVFAEGVA